MTRLDECDIIIRKVKGYGWLPIIEVAGKEEYRGSYHPTPIGAVLKAEYWLEAHYG